jgi:hypothetical protein
MVAISPSCINSDQRYGNRDAELDNSPLHLDWETIINPDSEINSLSEIAQSISYIRLTTPEDQPIDRISQIQKTDNFLFILDRSGIKMFDESGSFVRTIGNKGRGPNEYISYQGFMPDEDKQILVCTDANNSEIHFYNFSGAYLKQIQLKFRPYQISIVKGGLYCISVLPESQENSNLRPYYIVINEIGDILIENWSVHEIDQPDDFFLSFVSKLEQTSLGTFITPAFCDTTYLLSSSLEKTPFVISDFGKYKLPKDLQTKGSIDDGREKYITNFRIRLVMNNLLITYTYNNSYEGLIWDTKTVKSTRINRYLKDDIDNGPDVFLGGFNERYILDQIEPFKLLADSSLANIRKNSYLYEIANSLTENDNTILRFIELKY